MTSTLTILGITFKLTLCMCSFGVCGCHADVVEPVWRLQKHLSDGNPMTERMTVIFTWSVEVSTLAATDT